MEKRRYAALITRALSGINASLLFAALILNAQTASAQETALDRYIARPDPSYSWKLINTIPGKGFHGYVIDLTSQTWRSAAEVDRPVWKHWLTIVKPDNTTSNKALLFIGGGNNRDAAPAAISERLSNFAMETNTVVAELGMVPNQPLFFFDSKDKGRSEDDLIAYSRVKQIETRLHRVLYRAGLRQRREISVQVYDRGERCPGCVAVQLQDARAQQLEGASEFLTSEHYSSLRNIQLRRACSAVTASDAP